MRYRSFVGSSLFIFCFQVLDDRGECNTLSWQPERRREVFRPDQPGRRRRRHRLYHQRRKTGRQKSKSLDTHSGQFGFLGYVRLCEVMLS